MRRRDFIKCAGSVVAWPSASGITVDRFCQQRVSPNLRTAVSGIILKGLGEAGYFVGGNVAIEYRWADGQHDRLPSLAADLVKRQVAVIAATSTPAALAAKAATTTIPIVFETGADPVKIGLVTSLNRPGGNVTGVTQTNAEITPKRLQLLHELRPTAKVIVLLVNPTDPANAEANTRDVQAAADSLGLQLHVVNASSDRDINEAFEKLIQIHASGLVIGSGPFFVSQAEKLGALAARHAVPIIYEFRRFAAAGGLMSYGSEITEAYQLAGIYTGRVLKGDKPADLPVQQATRVELIINLKTAKALGITVPKTIIGARRRGDRIDSLAAVHESGPKPEVSLRGPQRCVCDALRARRRRDRGVLDLSKSRPQGASCDEKSQL
jgi:putative tryptophan/tyrosine transport system substrate-binding protein